MQHIKTSTYNIKIYQDVMNLVIKGGNDITLIDISNIVDNVLIKLIGTIVYRDDCYNPIHSCWPHKSKLIFDENGLARLVTPEGHRNRSIYFNFFNAPKIIEKNVDWISEIKKEFEISLNK